MNLWGLVPLAVCILCIWYVSRRDGGKIEITGMTASSLTCIAIGAVGIWWLFRISTLSIPFLICCLVFLAAGGVIGYFAFKKGRLLKQIVFTGFAAIAVVTGFIGLNMLFIW
jgi:hypothetical protein